MKWLHFRRAAYSAVMLLTVVAAISIADAQTGSLQTGGGISVYLGVLPAAIVQGHPKGHAEQAMHDGVPRRRDAHHVMAAVFDAANGKRIENAKVEARVLPIGLAGAARTLEPMQIAGTITYGNYFAIQPNEPYRILITVTRDGETQPVTMEFSHEHRTR